MDFNLKIMRIISGISVFIIILFSSCSEKQDDKGMNTFYIDLENFTSDSLRTSIEKGFFGKVSFYKDGGINIISENYITENLTEIHYFYNAEGLKGDIKDGTKKIKIEFMGDFSYDTISYSLQKYKFTNKKWVKISDIGVLKSFTKLIYPEYQIKDLGKKIILNTIEYSYN